MGSGGTIPAWPRNSHTTATTISTMIRSNRPSRRFLRRAITRPPPGPIVPYGSGAARNDGPYGTTG